MKKATMLYKVEKFCPNTRFIQVPKNLKVLLLVTFLSSFLFTDAFAAIKTFTGTGNFSAAAKWGGSLPLATDNLIINGTCTFDNAAANLVYGTLKIGNTSLGILQWPVGGNNTLNVTSVSSSFVGANTLNMTNGGVLIIRGAWTSANLTFTPGTGTIDIRVTMTLPAAYTSYKNLTIGLAGVTATTGIGITVSGNITITLGTLAANHSITVGGNWTRSSSANFNSNSSIVTFNGTGAQSINGTAASQGFYDIVVAKTAGTLLNTGGSTVQMSMNNLTLTSGDFTAPATMFLLTTASATLTISSGTFTAGANLSMKGNMNVSSAANFVPGLNTITIQGNANELITGTATSLTFYNLIVINAGTVVTTGDSIVTINVTNYTQTSGDFIFPPTFNVTNLVLTAGTLTAGENINVAGNWTKDVAGIFAGGTGTVTFNSAGAQTINGTAASQTFNHLLVAKTAGTLLTTGGSTTTLTTNNFTETTGNCTAPATLNINGNLLLTAGTFTAGTIINVAGNWTNNGGSFTPGTYTVEFNGTGAQAINGTAASQTFNNIIVSKTAGTLLSASGNTTTLTTNDFTQTSGNFTAPSTMNMIGTPTATLTLNGGNFTAGLITNITGNWTNNGGTFTPGLNILVFNGSGAQIINGTAAAQTFYNVILNKTAGTTLSIGESTTTLIVSNFTETTGDFTAPATLNINDNLTLTSGTFTAGATINISGDWINNGGLYVPGTNNVIFNSAWGQAIKGTAVSQTFYNLEVAKTAATTLNVNGGTTTLTTNNLTETTGNFTAPATLNINGSLLLSTGTFTAGTITNIKGNWIQNGGSFVPATNTVIFNGTGTKTLGGSNLNAFYNLTLNTSGISDAVQLSTDAQVTGSLDLLKGVFDLNSKSLSVTNGLSAAITRTAGYILSEQTDNSSNVIWSIGNNLTLHTYPFGTASGSYIPFILDLTAGDIGNVTVSTYLTGSDNTPYPNAPDPVTNMNGYTGSDNSANTVDRFWQIDKDGVSGTATLTFTATPAEVGAIMLPTAQRWKSTSPEGWEAPLSGQTNTATSSTVPGVTTFSPWTMSSQAAILPVELVSFNAVYANPFVSLTWVTESELNSNYFIIERTTDEKTFKAVGEVKAAGQSIQTLNYQSLDKNPSPGVSYYRLKQVDFDGTTSYSDLVAIEIMTPAEQISVFPNPASDFLNVRIESQEDASTIQIINMTGQIVMQKNLHKENGSHNQQLDIRELKPGLHYVIKSGDASVRGKFVKR